MPENTVISTEQLSAWFSQKQVLKEVSLAVPEKKITAIIGPSGCGKSTFVRCLNRLHEEIPVARCGGKVIFDGKNIYDLNVDPVLIRRRIGMVFQKPNPFPAMTVLENAVAGLLLESQKRRSELEQIAEKYLKLVSLWEEVKDSLHHSGASLSGGQQQRLCIARALAMEPEIVLLDEPCSALDPISTARIEELLLKLKISYTIIIVTHNMQQAARVADKTAFLLMGELIEVGETSQIFKQPKDKRTEDYITGRFG